MLACISIYLQLLICVCGGPISPYLLLDLFSVVSDDGFHSSSVYLVTTHGVPRAPGDCRANPPFGVAFNTSFIIFCDPVSDIFLYSYYVFSYGKCTLHPGNEGRFKLLC